MSNLTLFMVSAAGMVAVGIASVIGWRRISREPLRWFWAGAGLWTVAVAVKVAVALLTNKAVLTFLHRSVSRPFEILAGGCFVGIQSSLCEIGFTWIAVLIWRQLGRDANRAIAIGVGAGAFEAILLGLAGAAGVIAAATSVPGTETARHAIETAMAAPFAWLVGPVERILAICVHASSRALVLLGVTRRKPAWVFWGFLIFTMVDAIAGAAHVSGFIGKFSTWWIELALLPLALVSIPILRNLHARCGNLTADNPVSLPDAADVQ